MYRLRHAADSDFAAIQAVEAHAAQRFSAQGYTEIARGAWLPDAALKRHLDDGALFVIEWQRTVVAMVACAEIDGSAYLAEMDVSPDHAGQRLGMHLLARVECWARQRRLPDVWLTTFRDIPFNAPFYSRCGYVTPALAERVPDYVQAQLRREAQGPLSCAARVAMVKRLRAAKRIVLTGGPGVGKSTILEVLAALGHNVVSEVFTQAFAAAGSRPSLMPGTKDAQNFVDALFQHQWQSESQTSFAMTFLDRSLIDVAIFAAQLSCSLSLAQQEAIQQARYDHVFAFAPLHAVHYARNPIRTQTQEEALNHHEQVLLGYQRWIAVTGTADVVLVPAYTTDRATSVTARVRHVIGTVLAE